MITAELIGDRAVIVRLSNLEQSIPAGVARTVISLVIQLQRLIMQKLSGSVLHVRTGVLRSSITHREEITATSIRAMVGTAVEYARYHEYGVPHSWEIRPKSARALHFQAGGEHIFATYVIHPPLPERSFERSALEEMRPIIIARINEALAEAVRR